MMSDDVNPRRFGWLVPLSKPAILLIITVLFTVLSLRLSALLLSRICHVLKRSMRAGLRPIPAHAVTTGAV